MKSTTSFTKALPKAIGPSAKRLAGIFLESDYPYKSLSVLAAGARLNVPVTAPQSASATTILHEHPNFRSCCVRPPASLSRFFLAVCHTVNQTRRRRLPLHGISRHGARGVSQGSLDGPQCLPIKKAAGLRISRPPRFDLIPISGDWQARSAEVPTRNTTTAPGKTILVRTVARWRAEVFMSVEIIGKRWPYFEAGGHRSIVEVNRDSRKRHRGRFPTRFPEP